MRIRFSALILKGCERQGTDELTERALAYGVNALLGYEL